MAGLQPALRRARGMRPGGRRRVVVGAGVATLVWCAAGGGDAARASGFALKEQSVTAQGNAFAGASATAEDASAMFFNPAALALLPASQLTAAATWIAPSYKFKAKGASTLAGTPITGGNGGSDVGDDVLLPAAYGVVAIDDPLPFGRNLRFGLGVNVPFGLETDYNQGWIGRYHALQSKLKTINLNPAVALEVLDRLSLGAGLQVQYVSAELSNAVDFGSIGEGIPALAPIAVPTQQDGKARVEGSDWGVGYTLGALYQPWDGTRIGVGYRSHIRHELKGDARFRFDDAGVGQAISAASGAFTKTSVRTKLDLPETVSIGAAQALGRGWTLLGEAAWTRWSRFDELKIRFGNPAQPDSITEEQWNDTWFFALGATYQARDDLLLRFGAAYDQSPVPNSKRTPRVPDQDRFWLSVGATYQPAKTVSVSAGYTHIFLDDSSINLRAADTGNAGRGDLSADIDAGIDLFGVQVQWRF